MPTRPRQLTIKFWNVNLRPSTETDPYPKLRTPYPLQASPQNQKKSPRLCEWHSTLPCHRDPVPMQISLLLAPRKEWELNMLGGQLQFVYSLKTSVRMAQTRLEQEVRQAQCVQGSETIAHGPSQRKLVCFYINESYIKFYTCHHSTRSVSFLTSRCIVPR